VLRSEDALEPYQSRGQARLLGRVANILSFKPHHSFSFRKLTPTPLSTTNFVRLSQTSSPFATSTRYSSTESVLEPSTKMSSIVHVVLFQFKPEVSPETILDVQQPFHCSSIYAGHFSDPKCHRFASRCSRSRIGASPPRLTSHTSNQSWVVWIIVPRAIRYENTIALSILLNSPC
jgi:hypothetical protein